MERIAMPKIRKCGHFRQGDRDGPTNDPGPPSILAFVAKYLFKNGYHKLNRKAVLILRFRMQEMFLRSS